MQEVNTQATGPELSEDYPLTPEQAANYQQNGHILLEMSPPKSEMDFYRPVIRRGRLPL